jgi:hypothetical protein
VAEIPSSIERIAWRGFARKLRRYHPHVHLLVSAGGWSQDQRWVPPKHPNFFVPVRALSVIFRAKIRHALAQAHLLNE